MEGEAYDFCSLSIAQSVVWIGWEGRDCFFLECDRLGGHIALIIGWRVTVAFDVESHDLRQQWKGGKMRSRLVAAASRWQQCSLLHPVTGADLRLVMQPFRLDCPVRSP